MTVVTVNGLGERHLAAERATLTARVAIAHADRSVSMAQGAAVHARLAESVAALRNAGSATWHSIDVLATNVRVWTDKDGKKHQDHVTSGSVTVKLAQLNVVADVVADLSGLGAGVSTAWALTEATKLRTTRELRIVAVQDARAKADDFAAALGATVNRVASIRESQPATAPGMRGAPGGVREELTIPEITVSVAVVGEFETD